ncbi:MAG: hypothetical protein ACREMY_06500, partial [bacterium]
TEQRPAGGVTSYSYDDRGRALTISRGPSSTDLRERIEYTYDPLTGKKSLERILGFEGGAWVEKKRESFAYDGLGQLLTITHADGASIAYAYDVAGRVATMRDENHSTPNTTYAYDPAGRVAVVNQTLSTAPNGTITTNYTYDIHGNLSSVTDPNGNVTTYASSDFGQVITQQSPVTGATGYAYDSAGNLVNSIDANGTTTVRIYDAMGRPLLAVSTKNGEVPPVTSRGLSRPIVRQSSNESETVSWTYDDPTVGQFGIGRMASMTDPAGATTYAYERRGLLRTEQRAVASGIGLTTFRYDADANRISIGYPSGRVVNYSFDYADRPTSASSGTATLVSSAAYLPFGPAKDIVYGNGTEQTMSYDARYRLMTNKLAGQPGTIDQHDYSYDATGNIIQLADALDAGYSRIVGYDDLNRLTTANTGASLWGTGSYTYDTMGNMLQSKLGDPAVSMLAGEADFTYVGTTPKIATVRNTSLIDTGGLSLKKRRARASSVGYSTVRYDAAGNEISYVATRSYS